MGLTDGLKKGRKKLRVPIPLLSNERNQYLYPQPLMHIRLSISCCNLKKKQKAADKTESN